jgi:hypothetical protein
MGVVLGLSGRVRNHRGLWPQMIARHPDPPHLFQLDFVRFLAAIIANVLNIPKKQKL